MPFFLGNFESSVKKFIDDYIDTFLNLNLNIIKLKCSESRKIPVIFLPFLYLKNVIQNYILFKKILVCLFCGLDPCPRKFLVVRLIIRLIILSKWDTRKQRYWSKSRYQYHSIKLFTKDISDYSNKYKRVYIAKNRKI